MHLADVFIQSNLQCIQAIYIFFISMCVPWELNQRPFALLTQCSTTEPHEHITECLFDSRERSNHMRPKYLKQYWFAKIKSGRVLGAVICSPRTIWNKPIRAQPQVTCISKVYRRNRHPLKCGAPHTNEKVVKEFSFMDSNQTVRHRFRCMYYMFSSRSQISILCVMIYYDWEVIEVRKRRWSRGHLPPFSV